MIDIINNIATVTLILANGDIRSFPKLVSRAELLKNRVVIKDTSRQVNDVMTVNFQQIQNLSVSSNAELCARWTTFFNSGVGSGVSFSDTATVKNPISLNDATAVKIADANDSRGFFEVNMLPGIANKCVFIRLYAKDDDNIKRGGWIGQFNQGNDVFFSPEWRMSGKKVYTGEISAIVQAGAQDVYVTEY